MEEKGREKRRQERMQKKEDSENKDGGKEADKAAAEATDESNLTERQRLAIQAQKDKEETVAQRKEEIARSKVGLTFV